MTDAALIVNPRATRVTPELTVAVERELHAERVVVPGHGHNPQLSPAFTAALLDFVTRASTRRA